MGIVVSTAERMQAARQRARGAPPAQDRARSPRQREGARRGGWGELRALLEAGSKRLIDSVVLQTTDRMIRLVLETVSILVELLEVRIRAFSCTTGEEYKADSPTDRFLLAVKGLWRIRVATLRHSKKRKAALRRLIWSW